MYEKWAQSDFYCKTVMTGNYKYEDLFVEQTEQHIAIDYIGSNQSSLFLFKV